MSEPDPEGDPPERPTTDRAEAEEQGEWMIKHWVGIAVVSILGLWLLMVAVMQATGLMNVFAPIAETETQQWGAFAALVVVWLALAGWSWNALAS